VEALPGHNQPAKLKQGQLQKRAASRYSRVGFIRGHCSYPERLDMKRVPVETSKRVQVVSAN
jgi:hypothetical protein